MDVKTLSTIIGHVSSATTLNGYTHVTDDMKKAAAVKIDQSIAKEAPPADMPQAEVSHTMTGFKPQRGKCRYWGSGYLGQPKGEGHRWNGRYTIKWSDGRKEPRNIYADTKEEREKLLAEMIVEMKAGGGR